MQGGHRPLPQIACPASLLRVCMCQFLLSADACCIASDKSLAHHLIFHFAFVRVASNQQWEWFALLPLSAQATKLPSCASL